MDAVGDGTKEERKILKRSVDKDDGPTAKKRQRVEVDHNTNVADHYNRLQEAGLTARSQSRIFFMRNFNNWMKRWAPSFLPVTLMISDTVCV